MANKQKDRENFWLELGPAAEFEGMPSQDVIGQQGSASPDGRLRGYTGAQAGKQTTPERQNTEDDEFSKDVSGTVPARQASNALPYDHSRADELRRAHEAEVKPLIGPVPEPWATPDPPTGLPVIPPDGGLPPI